MANGYLSQIRFLAKNISEAIDPLEGKVVHGIKDEAALRPGIEELSKHMENYVNGMRSIKSAFVTWLKPYTLDYDLAT